MSPYDAWKTATDPEPHYEPPYDADGACSNRDRCAWPGCTIVAGDRVGACEFDPPDAEQDAGAIANLINYGTAHPGRRGKR